MSAESNRYPVPARRYRCQIEVERSRFITTVQEATSAGAARALVSEIKAEFADASHNCWTYLVGPPGSSNQIGLSDDGEPHGVAGRPMLTTLKHSGLGDTVVVVTRYFGGIKLGKGGMVKAYTAAVKEALEKLPRRTRIEWVALEAVLEYSLLAQLEPRLAEFECEVLATEYTDKVRFQLRVPEERFVGFGEMFAELTAGRGEVRPLP